LITDETDENLATCNLSGEIQLCKEDSANQLQPFLLMDCDLVGLSDTFYMKYLTLWENIG